MFQLIGLVFYGAAALNRIGSDISFAFEWAAELAENILAEISQLDFRKVLLSLFLATQLPLVLGPLVIDHLSKADFDVPESAYFVGFLIGYIIEVAIGILLTGGSLTLASVLKEAFVVPARAVAGGAKLAARAGRKLSKNVFEFLLKFLRDELPKFIRKLNDPQKLIDEIVEGVKEFLSASGKAGLKSERELLKLVERKYRATLRRDLKANPELKRWFSDRPELIDAWTKLKSKGLDDLSTNPEALMYIDDLKSGAKFDNNGVESFREIKSIWDKKFPSTVNPDGTSKIVRHHAIEQKILNKYPSLITKKEMHSIVNLRGIPKEINPDLHLSKIRVEWNKFYKQFDKISASPTKQQLLDKAKEIDELYGDYFIPPL